MTREYTLRGSQRKTKFGDSLRNESAIMSVFVNNWCSIYNTSFTTRLELMAALESSTEAPSTRTEMVPLVISFRPPLAKSRTATWKPSPYGVTRVVGVLFVVTQCLFTSGLVTASEDADKIHHHYQQFDANMEAEFEDVLLVGRRAAAHPITTSFRRWVL